MQEDKNQIVSGILRARAELEQVLYEMEKLPAISESAVHFAAHSFRLPQYQELVHGSGRMLPGSHEGKEHESRTIRHT